MLPTIGKWRWLATRLFRQVWVRSVSFGVAGVVTALAARPLARLLPSDLGAGIGGEAVDQVLGILASSMLTVATFSLSITVAAFAVASNSATPRAIQLLQEDLTTQNVLATFVGAFLFSLVGIVALHSGLYDSDGRVVLYAASIVVVGLVVAALLRWISHLMSFGRMGDTLERVERAAKHALEARLAAPYLGGQPMREPPPRAAHAVYAGQTGYVQHVDVTALSECAEQYGARVWLSALPGSFVHPAAPLVWWTGEGEHELPVQRIRDAYSCGDCRNYDQDPRFGLIVLAEIASRALSPGVNDPGTAIDVLGRLIRVLGTWREAVADEVRFPRIYVPAIQAAEMIEDAFQPIARDGAHVIEVQIRLHKALHALAAIAPEVFGAAAGAMAREALARARHALTLESECTRLEALTAELALDTRTAEPPAGI